MTPVGAVPQRFSLQCRLASLPTRRVECSVAPTRGGLSRDVVMSIHAIIAADIGSGSHGGEPRLDIPERRATRLPLFVSLLVVLALVAVVHAISASAETVDDLRGDIPTGDALRAELLEIADERAARLASLTAAESALAEVLSARDRLDGDARRLAAEIEAATTNLRRLAVEAFITGGDLGLLEHLAAVGTANDFAWQRHLVRAHAGSSRVAVDRLRNLRDQAGDDVLETIAEADRLRHEITMYEGALDGLDDREAALWTVMPLAEAWDRAAIAIAEGQWGIAPPEKWQDLRLCESTHNYQAISPSGLYRGAYQFDLPTWETVGGSGDPAMAPPEEQDARARELYARRGPQPWPVCGRFLE